MPVDELPMYPTPQQAAYTVGNQSHGSSRKQSHSKQSNVVYRPAPQLKPVPSPYSHLQPHNTQPYQGQPPVDYHNQYLAPSHHQHPPQPPPQQYAQYQPPPAQQYYQPQPVPVPVQPSYGSYDYSGSPRNVAHSQPQSHPQPQHHPPQSYQQAPPQHPSQQQPQQPPQQPQVPPQPSQPPQQQRYQSFGNAQPASLHQNPHKKPPPSLDPPNGARAGGSHSTPTSSKESLLLAGATPLKQPVSSKQKLENELKSVFNKVDVNHSGRISAKELSLALLNFDHTRFQDSTISLMIKLFSGSNGSSSGSLKSLTFEQFVSLWKYLSAYKKLFIAADSNKSGDISFGEFQKVLEQIGYKLNIDLVLHLFQKFSYKTRDESFDDSSVGKLKFDSFIELLVYLRKLTDIFKKYDKELSGVATINFLDFLFEVSNLS